MKELHYVLEKCFMIRRLKKEVLAELPDKRRQKIDIQPDETYLPRIKSILVDQLNELRDKSQNKEKHFEKMFSKTADEFEVRIFCLYYLETTTERVNRRIAIKTL